MQIIGAFLAEHAEVVDQKLNVAGGILDWITIPKADQLDDHSERLAATYYLVTLMQAPVAIPVELRIVGRQGGKSSARTPSTQPTKKIG